MGPRYLAVAVVSVVIGSYRATNAWRRRVSADIRAQHTYKGCHVGVAFEVFDGTI